MTKYNTKIVINKFIDAHGDKYDYSKFIYNGIFEKGIIICPKHGEFLQTPNSHLMGCGCPKCNQSKMEKRTENTLSEYKIKFISQKRFEWLGQQSLDFYLPDYNVAIECQGKQHFEPVDFKGESSYNDLSKLLNENILRDENKFNICAENGIKIYYLVTSDYYISNSFIYQDENTFNNVSELIENIVKKIYFSFYLLLNNINI